MTPQEFASKIKTKYPQYASMDDNELTQKMVQKYPQYQSQIESPKPQGMMGQISSLLDKPEQMSRQGLGQLAGMVPQGKVTGNLPMDLLRGTPKIAADTMAQVAPGFVSKGSMLAAGAAPIIGGAMKAAAPLGRSIGAGLEDWAGIKPSGTISEAFKGTVTGLSKGTGAAKPLYQAAAKELPYEQGIFKGVAENKDIANKAIEIIDKGGKLEPQEALTARKALDATKKRFSSDAFNYYRKTLDSIAKSNENIAAADPTFKRGMMAESLRSIAPKNVGGRVSPFKIAEGLAMSHMGPVGKVVGAALSPAVLGAASGGLGLASRIASNPAASVTALQLMRKKRKNEDSNP